MNGNIKSKTQKLVGSISTKSSIKGTISGESSLSGKLNSAVIGTNDYNKLTNKPQINDVTLIGNRSLQELDIQKTMDNITNLDIERLISD